MTYLGTLDLKPCVQLNMIKPSCYLTKNLSEQAGSSRVYSCRFYPLTVPLGQDGVRLDTFISLVSRQGRRDGDVATQREITRSKQQELRIWEIDAGVPFLDAVHFQQEPPLLLLWGMTRTTYMHVSA